MQTKPKDRDERQAPRTAVPPMYSHIRVRPRGDSRYRWTGFVYDISTSGMRFELDQAVQLGTSLDVHITLPGRTPVTFRAGGTVVRMHDDEPGPVRMGMAFDQFASDSDRKRLSSYVRNAAKSAA
jgi:hypothetical protein